MGRIRAAKTYYWAFSLAALSAMTISCSNQVSFERTSPRSFTCGISGAPPAGPNNGILGSIFHLEQSQIDAGLGSQLSHYFQHGTEHAVPNFLSNLDLPTQAFSRGFEVPGIGPLRKPDGTVLNEWFGLKLQTLLQLTDSDSEGRYQIAVLSDDGSKVKIGPNQEVTLVNNDGITPTRFKVAQEPIVIRRGDQIPLEVKYFQGPKYHISLILMWRHWSGNPTDPADGQAGNDMWFDSTVSPSTPKQPYLDLLSRGWRPIGSGNYVLPDGLTNPCF